MQVTGSPKIGAVGEGLRDALRRIAMQFPPELVESQLDDVERVACHIDLVHSEMGADVRLCDVGGGIGLFSVGCAAVGMRVILMDDFGDDVNRRFGDSPLTLHRHHGVRVETRDVIADGIALPPASLDVVTTFDAVEHWHHSPKRLFASVVETLVPGGLFLLGAPNCVNLRKRLTVPLGRGKWSSMADWYECPTFRGHVREPDVEDLRYIAKDMGLVGVRILGRNWSGRRSPSRAVRLLSRATDHVLRLRPALCSDIYLLGRKPARGEGP